MSDAFYTYDEEADALYVLLGLERTFQAPAELVV